MALKIEQVSPSVVYGRSPAFPCLVYVGVDDGKIVGAGGLAWNLDRTWLWVDHVDKMLANPLTLVRWGKRMLQVAARYGDTSVFAVRDPEVPSAEKLLKLLGFKPVVTDKLPEIWECRVSL